MLLSRHLPATLHKAYLLQFLLSNTSSPPLNKKQFEEMEQTSEPELAMAGVVGFSDHKYFKN